MNLSKKTYVYSNGNFGRVFYIIQHCLRVNIVATCYPLWTVQMTDWEWTNYDFGRKRIENTTYFELSWDLFEPFHKEKVLCCSVVKTLPKAQRTRGLSSSHQSNLMGHITSSNTNLDQISSSKSRPSINFKISTKHQHFD